MWEEALLWRSTRRTHQLNMRAVAALSRHLPWRPSTSKASILLNRRLNFPGYIRQMMAALCTADCASVSTLGTSEMELPFLTWLPVFLCKDALRRHVDTSKHKLAVQLEGKHLASDGIGGIFQAFSEAVSTQRKTALGAMKCLYRLAKNEVAHTTKYVRLLQLAQS